MPGPGRSVLRSPGASDFPARRVSPSAICRFRKGSFGARTPDINRAPSSTELLFQDRSHVPARSFPGEFACSHFSSPSTKLFDGRVTALGMLRLVAQAQVALSARVAAQFPRYRAFRGIEMPVARHSDPRDGRAKPDNRWSGSVLRFVGYSYAESVGITSPAPDRSRGDILRGFAPGWLPHPASCRRRIRSRHG